MLFCMVLIKRKSQKLSFSQKHSGLTKFGAAKKLCIQFEVVYCLNSSSITLARSQNVTDDNMKPLKELRCSNLAIFSRNSLFLIYCLKFCASQVIPFNFEYIQDRQFRRFVFRTMQSGNGR